MFTKNVIGLISGIGLLLFGSWLLYLALVTKDAADITILVIYGGFLFIAGVFMFFNLNKEDIIEEVKEEKK